MNECGAVCPQFWGRPAQHTVQGDYSSALSQAPSLCPPRPRVGQWDGARPIGGGRSRKPLIQPLAAGPGQREGGRWRRARRAVGRGSADGAGRVVEAVVPAEGRTGALALGREL